MHGRARRRVRGAVSTALVALVVLLAAALVGVRLAGLRPYVILSGSMEPAYPVGSLVYVRSVAAETVEAGDPIAFVMNGDGVVAIHRVVSVDAAAATFRTKGDANDAPDAAPVAFASLIGMPVLCVPYLGYVSDYITRPPGLYLGGAAALLAVVLLLLPDRERARARARRRATQRAMAEAERALREAEAAGRGVHGG